MLLFSAVRGSLHDPGGFRQEQPHRYLHRLLRCRSRSGVGLLIALVRLPHSLKMCSFSLNTFLTIHMISASVFRSMLPDVVDDFQVQNPESNGHEALFYSFYVFFTKFASGVSLGISTLSLE